MWSAARGATYETGENPKRRGSEMYVVNEVMYALWPLCIHRVSRGECDRLRENVPYVKVHRYNPKHLYPKLNGYGDNGERSLKV